jgi:DNA-binding CsgD family transcriptional regulator
MRATVPSENKRLQVLIQAATAAANGRGLEAGGAMIVSRPSLLRPYVMLVSPLHLGDGWAATQRARAVVFITDPETEFERQDQALERLFGLTPAESRLACILASGKSLKQAAEELSVSRNTVHSQLQKVFEKTGANRQADLVRLLLKSPIQYRPTDMSK